jgi:cytochrome c-type biogenesis protein CcmH/NrfG
VLEALAAAEASPDDSSLQVALGNAWRAAGFNDMALDAYQEACRIDPGQRQRVEQCRRGQ